MDSHGSVNISKHQIIYYVIMNRHRSVEISKQQIIYNVTMDIEAENNL